MNNQQINQNEKDKFYQELDEKSSHKSCCTCQAFVILFLIILFIATGVIFYFYWQITRGGIFKEWPKVTTSSDFAKKLEKPQVSKTGQFQIELTSDELTGLLSEGMSSENFVLKEIRVSVTPSNMLLYGTLVKPIGSKVVVTSVPKVENKKLKLAVINISAGNINLPAILNNSISSSLSGLFDKKLASFYDSYEVEKVVLEDNQILIIGKIKGR